MKVLVFLCLVALAVGDECGEERAEQCVDALLTAILADATEEEVCRELRTSVDCLKDAVDECLGDERDEDVDQGLEELEKVLRENCGEASGGNDDEDEEMAQCFQDNEDYINECLYEGATAAMHILMEEDNIDQNTMRCLAYSMIADCFVTRVGEKCGKQAASIAQEALLTELPDEIKEACEQASHDLLTHDFNLLEDKKKK